MSLLNANQGQGDANKGTEGGGAEDKNKADGAAGNDQQADRGNKAADANAEGNKEAVNDGEFDINGIGEDLKNPEVYKNGLFFGKYKNLGEASKGFKEAVGKIVEKAKAPDEYDFTKLTIEGMEGVTVDKNDPVAQAMLPVLKELGVPQEQADKLASAYLKVAMAGQVDPAKEFEALGKEGPAMLENLKEMLPTLTKEEQEDVLEVTKTAAGVRILNRFAKNQTEAIIPGDAGVAEGLNAAQLRDSAFAYKEKHAKTIESNEVQQQEYNRLMEAWVKADDREKRSKK